MSGKDVFIDFISYVLGLLMFAFVIFYIILGDRFDMAIKLFYSLIPFIIFSLVAVVILNIRKLEIKRKKDEDNYYFSLFLNFSDKLTSDIVYTGLPVLILLAAFILKGVVEMDDVIQASLVFGVLCLYFKVLYNKTR